nr:efflux RND transporter periplasmic adaptor subunit [Rahnella bruchi]
MLYAHKSAETTMYTTALVHSGDIENVVLAAGRLDAAERVSVGAQVSGQVKSIWVRPGDRVKKGQPVADIDDQFQRNEVRTAVTALDVAKANLLAKQAQLKQAMKSYIRQRKLFQEGASSQQDFEDSESVLAMNRAEMQALKAQLAQAQIEVDKKKAELSYTRVLAPMDGIIIAVVTRQGQTVNSSQRAPTIIKLARLDMMTIKAQISEVDITHIHAGQEAFFSTFAEPDKQYQATLNTVELAPESLMADESAEGSTSANNAKSSVYYNVLLDVPNPANNLRIAMTAQVKLLIDKAKNTLLVPRQAVEKSPTGKMQVRVLTDENQPETREVITGITDNINIQILAGLKAGEQVILAKNNIQQSQEGI